MIPQRVAPFRGGRGLRFARYLGGLTGQAREAWWDDEPTCLVRWSYDTAEVVRESTASAVFERVRASSRGPRLMGMAASRAGDVLAIVHEDPEGARIVVRRGRERVAEGIWPEGHTDVSIVTDGRRIVVRGGREPTVWSCAAALRAGTSGSAQVEREPWPLAALQPSSEPQVTGLRVVGDAVLISTVDTWSRWSWDGQLRAWWRGPGWTTPYVLAWHEAGPVLFMPALDPATGAAKVGRDAHEVFVWDLAEGRGRSFGPARGWPCAARSPDGRWLVLDRVARAGRGLELWDVPAGVLVARLENRRRAAQALAFAPDGLHVAVATMDDFFVLRIDP